MSVVLSFRDCNIQMRHGTQECVETSLKIVRNVMVLIVIPECYCHLCDCCWCMAFDKPNVHPFKIQHSTCVNPYYACFSFKSKIPTKFRNSSAKINTIMLCHFLFLSFSFRFCSTRTLIICKTMDRTNYLQMGLYAYKKNSWRKSSSHLIFN